MVNNEEIKTLRRKWDKIRDMITTILQKLEEVGVAYYNDEGNSAVKIRNKEVSIKEYYGNLPLVTYNKKTLNVWNDEGLLIAEKIGVDLTNKMALLEGSKECHDYKKKAREIFYESGVEIL